MVSRFDIARFSSLLQDFYKITNIRITLFDESLHEVLSYPEEMPACCAQIRSCSAGAAACADCDRRACLIAAVRHETHVYRCHAGFTEAAAPLYSGDILTGYLLFGHLFSYDSPKEGREAVEAAVEELPIDLRQFHASLLQVRTTPEDYIRAAAKILRALSTYAIAENMTVPRPDDLSSRLDAWLKAHYTENADVETICTALGIGKSRLYKLSHELYGCPVAVHIRSLRVALAKELLLRREDYPLDEIAARCGYTDYNYFIAVFSKETGCSPGRWKRRMNREKA